MRLLILTFVAVPYLPLFRSGSEVRKTKGIKRINPPCESLINLFRSRSLASGEALAPADTISDFSQLNRIELNLIRHAAPTEPLQESKGNDIATLSAQTVKPELDCSQSNN